ncbi:MAG: alpha/beta hydrolase [Pseudomonadota bacterium]|nr:alpha/beta hydrolase [Pseudomonadota bacterium]
MPPLRLSVLALSSLLLTACASHHHAPASAPELTATDYTVERDLRFSPDDWPEPLYADLYLPDTDARPAPIVLIAHGGGWQRRSRDDMNWVAETLASRGFAVMNVDYRFAPEHRFPAQLHDLQIARQWLNRSAANYGLDATDVSGFGFSSGAHLIALLAVVASSGSDLNEPYGGPGTELNAVVAGGLPSDLTAFGSGKLLRQFLGGDPDEKPALYKEASPVSHVTPDTPPFFLFHGAMDMLVPFSQAEQMTSTLEENGVYHELYEMHLRGHITSFLTAGNAVDEALAFLVRQNNDT